MSGIIAIAFRLRIKLHWTNAMLDIAFTLFRYAVLLFVQGLILLVQKWFRHQNPSLLLFLPSQFAFFCSPFCWPFFSALSSLALSSSSRMKA
jgi:hypothetical protein